MALALFEIYGAALLSTKDVLEACQLLQTMAPVTYDSSRLLDVATSYYESLTMEGLDGLRGLYRDDVLKVRLLTPN